jgi:hypothetical protein
MSRNKGQSPKSRIARYHAKARQLGFALLEEKAARSFGGSLLKQSNPKVKRPITTKRAMHLVLWSAVAKGSLSLLRRRREIERVVARQGRLHGVQVYKQANGGNHLHLVIRPSSREAFQGFVRSVTGLIARLVLNTERGRGRKQKRERQQKRSDERLIGQIASGVASVVDDAKTPAARQLKLWSKRPFTRIVEWGRDFRGVLEYLTQNTLEALGFIPYQSRKSRYRESTA